MPCTHALLAKWIPPNERSRMGAFVYAGAQFGTVISMPLSGLLAEYGFAGGWPSSKKKIPNPISGSSSHSSQSSTFSELSAPSGASSFYGHVKKIRSRTRQSTKTNENTLWINCGVRARWHRRRYHGEASWRQCPSLRFCWLSKLICEINYKLARNKLFKMYQTVFL